MTNFLDVLIMLLSTDWFTPYWVEIGIRLDEAERSVLRDDCRQVVKQIIGGATEYWLISFSDERRDETRVLFESLAKKTRAEAAIVASMKEWSEMSDEDLKAGWLFDLLTEDLLSNDFTYNHAVPHSDIREVMAREREKQHHTDVDFGMLSNHSKSAWDRYVRQLTPDLPTYLANMLLNFLRARRFQLLWMSMQHKLNREQIEELASWYRSTARSRAQRSIAPSYFCAGSSTELI
ncbi:MAG: hypothetical protein LAP21_15430 [Acidobacteriia bacterium]|nr:hypothetical protein [Terriglobia bacterium]